MTEATLDALRDALGQIISSHRKQWTRERELMEAQGRATMAELRAEIVELKSVLEKMVGEKLGSLRDGQPGDKGDRGERGERGLQGLPGQIGKQGPAGETGERGEVGPAGERGERGEPGRDGEPGKPGEPGASVKGERGERGERGLQGLAGTPGDPGLRGERGERGEKGEPGLSIKGDAGERGDRGERGERGEKGDQGIPGIGLKGERGERGERGLQGLPGQIGLRGEPGIPGLRGEAGPAGERGERGLTGALPRVKVWEPGVHYANDVVSDDGATYQALRDTAEVPGNGKDWHCLARAGHDGDDGRSPEIRGLFDATVAYRKLDIVALNGGSFIAKKDDPGQCPGAGWQLIASQGKSGSKGERGERGLQGVPGATVSIIGWKVDEDSYSATPVMSDHTEGEPLPLRRIFERFHMEMR